MTLYSATTMAVAILALFGAGLMWRLARAPIWADLRRFAAVAASTAAYGLLEVVSTTTGSHPLFAASAYALSGSAPLIALSWLGYSSGVIQRATTALDRALARALLAGAALALIPGVMVDVPAARKETDPLLGWHHASVTPAGLALAAFVIGVGALVAARLGRHARRTGDRHTGALAISFAVAIGAGVVEALAHADWIRGPHPLGLALAVPLAAGAWLAASRFVADAEALHELQDRLEGIVEERTRELAEANAALLQAEKLAALGQFAAGVAHEVNNPASVVTSDLSWLSGALDRGAPPAETREVLLESLEAMRRINELVRKLLDAGRLADLPPGGANVALSRAVDRALDELRPVRSGVELVNAVPDDLLVRGGDAAVERIVLNLVRNGVEAIPDGRAGRVTVSARAANGGVRLVIEDDGLGMGAGALRRAFDPFFTTKTQGRGSGLGLPITRGLVEGIGGQIWLESDPGKGTRAAVELQPGTPS